MGALIKEIKLNLKDSNYKIIIGKGILKKAGYFIKRLDVGNYAYIISSHYIAKKYLTILSKSLQRYGIKSTLKLVQDTEEAKSLINVFSILSDIVNKDDKGNLFIIALGGGVVGDLSGFVAGIYKRGIPYIQIPTTLLAQIDSSIGGKTAVDLKEAKNLVGLFYQPSLVLSEIDCLKSLDLKQLRSGLAEAVKYGLIKDSNLLKYIETNFKKLLSLNDDVILKLVYLCAKIKAEIVQKDEKEKLGIRTILNFGHTIGHALEASFKYKGLSHGEAISLGIVSALKIGIDLGITKENLLERIESLLKKIGLPTRLNKAISFDRFIQAYYYDKKFRKGQIRFVLVKDVGKPFIKEGIKPFLIKRAFEYLLSPLN